VLGSDEVKGTYHKRKQDFTEAVCPCERRDCLSVIIKNDSIA
jgi:hypothetical protein